MTEACCMRRLLCLGAIFLALSLAAAPHLFFETETFPRARVAADTKGFVFSPYAFEYSSAVLAEAQGTIGRANMAERMGILVDFETAFAAARGAFSIRTNGFSYLSAQAFLLPDVHVGLSAFRLQLLRDYGVATCLAFPAKGAEAWLRAELEGEMEDFSIPLATSTAEHFSFCTLVSVRAAWTHPFDPKRTVKRPFFLSDGTTNRVDFMCGVEPAAGWETKDYDFVKIPLRGGANFYAMLPKVGFKLAEIRGDLSPVEIERFLSVTGSLTEKGVWKGETELVIPRLAMTTRTDLLPLFKAFRFPLSGYDKIAGKLTGRDFFQIARLSLTEGRADELPTPVGEGAEAAAPAPVRRLVFDRPFLFFIHHPDASAIPVFGEFRGCDNE